jgi:hypothetical protein
VTRTESVILGLVREAKELGYAPLLRTILHKFVYLADVYVAEETGGQTFTGERWEFLHFGPYSGAVAYAMDSLTASQCLHAEKRIREDDDIEFVLYSPRGSTGTRLREIGLPVSASLRLDADLRRYARNLPGLLDYVYFQTIPMEDARPHEVLRFDRCVKTITADYKVIEMLRIPSGKLRRTREQLRAILRNSQAAAVKFQHGPIDDVFLAGLGELDGESLPIGLSGKAKIADAD